MIKQINDAERNADFEKMYQLFNVYEQHFDLNEEIALKKCQMLLQLNAYLELREEAIILLKRGFNCYDELMIYYIKSLNGLGQFNEAVEVINQIIDEVKNHKTRMELFHLKNMRYRDLMKIERHCPHLYQISVRLTHVNKLL